MINIESLFKKVLLIIGVFGCSAGFVTAQDKRVDSDTLSIKNQLDNKSWTFVAQSASPMGARSIQLNGYNELVVNKDSMQSNLPYFGRAFSAPMNLSDGGYNFSAPIKTYAVTDQNKKGYDVSLTPKGRINGEKFSLSVFDNGTAMLTVRNTNRQPISFNGYLRKTK